MKKSIFLSLFTGLAALILLSSCTYTNVPLPAENIYGNNWEGKYVAVITSQDGSTLSPQFVDIDYIPQTGAYAIQTLLPVEEKGYWNQLVVDAQFAQIGDYVYFSYPSVEDKIKSKTSMYMIFEVDSAQTSLDKAVKSLSLFALPDDVFEGLPKISPERKRSTSEEDALSVDNVVDFESPQALKDFLKMKQAEGKIWKTEKEKKDSRVEITFYPIETFPKVKMQ
ncbi:MAG: hypothetical protein AAFO96_19420 [Bacteroidota bacterium]